MWNWGFRGDETFPVIEEAIREKYPDVTFVDFRKFGNFHDPSMEAQKMKELPELLKSMAVMRSLWEMAAEGPVRPRLHGQEF